MLRISSSRSQSSYGSSCTRQILQRRLESVFPLLSHCEQCLLRVEPVKPIPPQLCYQIGPALSFCAIISAPSEHPFASLRSLSISLSSRRSVGHSRFSQLILVVQKPFNPIYGFPAVPTLFFLHRFTPFTLSSNLLFAVVFHARRLLDEYPEIFAFSRTCASVLSRAEALSSSVSHLTVPYC